MSRTPAFREVARALRLAHHFESTGVSTRQGLEQIASARVSRRRFLAAAGTAAAAAAMPGRAFAASQPRIAVVGAGLSGLACADRLRRQGHLAIVYEAGTRPGGRCFSNRTLVPGMACENGGEFIDTGHKAMLAYANEFDLARESVVKQAGEESFHFFGQRWDEAAVVDEFRQVVSRMQDDLKRISGAATFHASNAADVELDHTDLATYFATRAAGFPLVQAVLNEAYLAEYGLETSRQSTLNFLGFMRLNR